MFWWWGTRVEQAPSIEVSMANHTTDRIASADQCNCSRGMRPIHSVPLVVAEHLNWLEYPRRHLEAHSPTTALLLLMAPYYVYHSC